MPATSADRPHWITVLIGLLSPSVALVALVMSIQSFRISQQALSVSQQSLIVGQRAYVHAKIHAENPHLKEYPNRWLFSVELINTGNTPAYVTDIKAEFEPGPLPSVPDGWVTQDISQTVIVGSRQSETVGFGAATIESMKPLPGYPPGGQLLPSVAVRYSYHDVFGKNHDELIKCNLGFGNGSVSQLSSSTASSDLGSE